MPFPSPGDLPDLGLKQGFPALQAESLLTELQGSVGIIRLFSFVFWFGEKEDFGSDDKDSACNAEDPGSIHGSGRSLEKGMAAHSSILAWSIPWTEEPDGLQSVGLQSQT